MNRIILLCAAAITFILGIAAASGYRLLKTIAVGGSGSWDYLTVDAGNRRVYVSHETEVEVLDADSGEIEGKIPNTSGVHGIAIAPEARRGFTSNGRASNVTIFDLNSLKVLGQVPTGKKPDAILYDSATRRVFAMNGGSNSSTAIDASTGNVVGTIDLGGGPEFGVADGSGNVYVNLEDENQTVHIDSANLTVRDRWAVAPCQHPSSMAMDRTNHRLFLGCRSRAMAVLNADTGAVITTLPIGDHVDATAFDPGTGLIFNSTGEGTVDIFHEDSPDKYSLVERLRTRPGSKTMALDPQTLRIFLPTMVSGNLQVLVFAR